MNNEPVNDAVVRKCAEIARAHALLLPVSMQHADSIATAILKAFQLPTNKF